MIKGIGCDIIEISRMAKAIENTGFLSRYFSEKENQYFLLKNNKPETVAAAFAAKEAFSKALGTGIRGFSLKDVEILHDELGKPYISLLNNAKTIAGDSVIHLSLSHCKEYAEAFVVIEGLDL